MTNEVVPDKSGAKNTEPPSRLLTTLFLKGSRDGKVLVTKAGQGRPNVHGS